MGKTRSPNRDKAFKIYKEHNGKITPKEIAEMLGEKIVNIYSWKKNDEWGIQLNGKVGAPKGNKNAVGNKGGAPKGNEYNLKQGKYRKFISKSELQLIDDFMKKGATPIDLLKLNIYITQSRLMTLMSVPNEEKIKSKGKNIIEYITEHEQFIDKTREFSSLLNKLTKLVTEHEALTGEKYNLELEEKKVKIDKIKVEINKLTGIDKDKQVGNLDKLIDVFNKGPVIE